MNDLPQVMGQASAPALQAPNEIAAAERERAEQESVIAIAKRFPRDQDICITAIVKCLNRPKLAEEARYKFPRGKTDISGPSVSLARLMAAEWGNIRYGVKVINETEDSVHIRGFAWDLEKTVYVELEDKFAKKIPRKEKVGGQEITVWKSPNERDLRELIFRRGAILERNCILKILPADFIDKAEAQAVETLRAVNANQLKENRDDVLQSIVMAFDKIGVTKEQVEEYLGNPLRQLNEEQLGDLRAVLRSIKDGNSRAYEYFGNIEEEQESPLEAKLKERKATKKPTQTDLPTNESSKAS